MAQVKWVALFALGKQTSNWIADSIGLNEINERVSLRGDFSAEAAPGGATAPHNSEGRIATAEFSDA